MNIYIFSQVIFIGPLPHLSLFFKSLYFTFFLNSCMLPSNSSHKHANDKLRATETDVIHWILTEQFDLLNCGVKSER